MTEIVKNIVDGKKLSKHKSLALELYKNGMKYEGYVEHLNNKIEKETIIEQRHVLDLTRVSNNDLNTIERALESALIDESESRKDEKVFKRVYQE